MWRVVEPTEDVAEWWYFCGGGHGGTSVDEEVTQRFPDKANVENRGEQSLSWHCFRLVWRETLKRSDWMSRIIPLYNGGGGCKAAVGTTARVQSSIAWGSKDICGGLLALHENAQVLSTTYRYFEVLLLTVSAQLQMFGTAVPTPTTAGDQTQQQQQQMLQHEFEYCCMPCI